MNQGAEKIQFEAAAAAAVAAELVDALRPAVERILVAGSLRRGKPLVSDVEILFIPKSEVRKDPENFFGTVAVNLAVEVIERLQREGIIGRRLNAKGHTMYGPRNKFMRHLHSGVPVDLFSTTEDCWHNYLVCRTGPAELNIRICREAEVRGWVWNPYGAGFRRGSEVRAMNSEHEVFEFVGMEYLEPEFRS